jgi:Fur family transcriptional regulator, ferric uptake regulator
MATGTGATTLGAGPLSLPTPNAAQIEHDSSRSVPTWRWLAATDASTANASSVIASAIRWRRIAFVRRCSIDTIVTGPLRLSRGEARGYDKALSFLGKQLLMERQTRQREAIQSVLHDCGRPLSPGEVHSAARKRLHGLGIATVYRTLNLLVDEGVLRVINLPGESARYEIAHLGHHHHFRCNTCHRVYDIPGCPMNMRRMAPRGFRVEAHDLTLYGRCSACRS